MRDKNKKTLQNPSFNDSCDKCPKCCSNDIGSYANGLYFCRNCGYVWDVKIGERACLKG